MMICHNQADTTTKTARGTQNKSREMQQTESVGLQHNKQTNKQHLLFFFKAFNLSIILHNNLRKKEGGQCNLRYLFDSR
jgi:hypothetical protein